MAALTPEGINYIVVHCSATTPMQDIGFAEIDKMHKARTYRTKGGDLRHWSGCGYHVIIRRDGTIEMGRSLQTKGAHVGGVGHNHDSWGVCLVGGISASGEAENNYSIDQLDSLERIVRGLLHRAPHAAIVGHRDLSPDLDGDGEIEPEEWLKQCPCFDVQDWWKGIISRAA